MVGTVALRRHHGKPGDNGMLGGRGVLIGGGDPVVNWDVLVQQRIPTWIIVKLRSRESSNMMWYSSGRLGHGGGGGGL